VVFVDTSGFHALLDADDQYHPVAGETWKTLLTGSGRLLTSNYVVVETCALLQRRLGMDAVKVFRDDILPAVEVEWVTPRNHEIGLTALIAASRRKLSLVDCISFVVMREHRCLEAFAFDAHFREEGFVCNKR
jgi:predicted nucleic acid-binding protein